MRIVLVDDDKLSRTSLYKFLTQYMKHNVTEFESANDALNHLKLYSTELVVSDIKMPGMTGIELLKEIKSSTLPNDPEVVLVTGFGEFTTAVQALRLGAYDYLQKPVDVDVLASIVKRVDEKYKLKKENEILSKNLKQKTEESNSANVRLNRYKNIYQEVFGLGKVGFYSKAMIKIENLINLYHDDREVNVLILGETGTGKEVVARMIHYRDGEELKPFVTVNCSAISPSLFESELFGYEKGAFTGAKSQGKSGKFDLAQGGTIFFDEIGDMPLEMQPKLLRVLQMKEFSRVGGNKSIPLDVRIIAATNRNLEEMVDEGRFRRDLLFRLNTGELHIPPLRERKDAIISLTHLFLETFSTQKNKHFKFINDAAAKILINYDWKGNIRELKNIIERAVLIYDDDTLKPDHFASNLNIEYNETLEDDVLKINLRSDSFDYKDLEKQIITKLLSHFKGNKSKTAKYLNITRNRLNRKLL